MDTVVVSIGGSILVPGEKDEEYIARLASELNRLSVMCKLYVVVGGGKHARYYIGVGRELGAGEAILDELGIAVTRLNARLLALALRDLAPQEIPEDVKAAKKLGRKYAIVVMGGTTPGHTTDAVSVELALAIGADRFVNASSVDGIYTADPRSDPSAKRLERLTFEELARITGGDYKGAGKNVVLDPVATGMLVGARLSTAVVNGRDLEALSGAILGKPFNGTTIG